MNRATDEWGCNCGPSALAFAARLSLDSVRPAIPDFDARRYTSPTMMKLALAHLSLPITNVRLTDGQNGRALEAVLALFGEAIGLIRIQWTGPWTAKGMNPRWAYRQSHWIAGWNRPRGNHFEALVFDCNGGIRTLESWEKEIVPILTEGIPRADGGWYPTHVWRITQPSREEPRDEESGSTDRSL